MLTYTYVARDTVSGRQVKAEISATDERSAAKTLMEKGLAPLEVKVKKESEGLFGVRGRIPTKAKVIFSRQLATLINAGLPLVQSLNNVRDQTANKPLRDVITEVMGDVEGGASFSNSLAKHPRVFSEVYTSLVAAGEESGTLDTSLERLAVQQEKDAEIVSKVRGALIYPCIVILVLLGVVVFMMTTVLPQVQSLYANLPGVKLPIFTRLLLGAAHFIISYWWICVLVIAGLVSFLVHWSRTAGGQAVLDRVKMRAWPASQLMMRLYMARFARTAATLIGSGVPMIKMLTTTADAVGNVHVAGAIMRASEEVKGGKPLSSALEGDSHFLSLVPDMIRTGEQSGALQGMLEKLATYYEDEVDRQIKAISTIIEPVLMIIVGVIALIIVAAVLLPIYGLAGQNLTNI